MNQILIISENLSVCGLLVRRARCRVLLGDRKHCWLMRISGETRVVVLVGGEQATFEAFPVVAQASYWLGVRRFPHPAHLCLQPPCSAHRGQTLLELEGQICHKAKQVCGRSEAQVARKRSTRCEHRSSVATMLDISCFVVSPQSFATQICVHLT